MAADRHLADGAGRAAHNAGRADWTLATSKTAIQDALDALDARFPTFYVGKE
jgi:hypothetical protein